MSMDNVPRCQHIKVNGTQCGCPALRRNRLCFFHKRFHERRINISAKSQRRYAIFDMPVLEDANSIQVSLMQIMRLMASGQMDTKIAGLMLYALQTASANLRHTMFEPVDVKDVVIDRNTVDRTCIDGSQWCEDDFMTEEEAEEASGEAEAEAEAEEQERKQMEADARSWRLLRDGPAKGEVDEKDRSAEGVARGVAAVRERLRQYAAGHPGAAGNVGGGQAIKEAGLALPGG